MTTELIIPEELWQARDELVDYALDGGPVPAGFHKIKAWFSESQDAYEQTQSDVAAVAVGSPYLTPWCSLPEACDQYLVDHYALDDDAEITDEQRIEFTRHLLAQVIERVAAPSIPELIHHSSQHAKGASDTDRRTRTSCQNVCIDHFL